MHVTQEVGGVAQRTQSRREPQRCGPIHGAVVINPHVSPPFCPSPLGLPLPHIHPIFKWRLLRSGWGTRGGRVCLKYAADPKYNKYLILFY